MNSWRQSGLSQAEFCKEHNLDTRHFSLWKQKIAEETRSDTKLIEIPVSAKRNGTSAGMQLPVTQRNKVTISVKLDEVIITLER